MEISHRDLEVLATYHGCSREAQVIRQRINEAGYRYCAHCETIRSADAFTRSSRRCRSCNTRKKGIKRRRPFASVASPGRHYEKCNRVRDRRKSVGMSLSQANYQADASEHEAAWAKIRKH